MRPRFPTFEHYVWHARAKIAAPFLTVHLKLDPTLDRLRWCADHDGCNLGAASSDGWRYCPNCQLLTAAET